MRYDTAVIVGTENAENRADLAAIPTARGVGTVDALGVGMSNTTLVASISIYRNGNAIGRETPQTREVPARVVELEWQRRGLQYTASGYGKKIPTRYQVEIAGKWRRVYCCIYSNSGTCYIGKFGGEGQQLLVSDVYEQRAQDA